MQHTPLILSTWSFGQRANAAGWSVLDKGGSACDAVEAACCAVEADEQVDSVGLGGLADANGALSLDACIMESPARSGAAVACRRHLHVTSIARKVMELTPHIMLAGEGADAFADEHGMTPTNLLTDTARAKWEAWRDDPTTIDQSKDYGLQPYLRPVDDGSGGGRLFHSDNQPDSQTDGQTDSLPDDEARWKNHDTVGVLSIDAHKTLVGACSTSGTPYKLPGRVGDSPIIGHGLYVDPHHGAAVATGTGELVMGVCGSFLAVESMRNGATPLDAAMIVLQRINECYELQPHHQVALIVLQPDGQWASAALRPGYRTAVRDRSRDDIVEPDATLLGD